MPRTTPYTEIIQRLAPDHDPRHVEAWMRLEHPTLDHLDRRRFDSEVRIAIQCIETAGKDASEELAVSYGF